MQRVRSRPTDPTTLASGAHRRPGGPSAHAPPTRSACAANSPADSAGQSPSAVARGLPGCRHGDGGDGRRSQLRGDGRLVWMSGGKGRRGNVGYYFQSKRAPSAYSIEVSRARLAAVPRRFIQKSPYPLLVTSLLQSSITSSASFLDSLLVFLIFRCQSL